MNETTASEQAQDLTEVSDAADEEAEAPAEQAERGQEARNTTMATPRWPGLIAIITLLAASTGGVYLWQRNELLGQRLAIAESRIKDQDARSERALRELGAETFARLKALEADTGRLDNMQRELQQAMDSVRHFAAKGPVGWVLAEVEFLLKTANHRVHLSNDPVTARAALQAADERLKALADPGFIPVREKIAAEIQALRALPPIDRTGIAARLKGMARQVDKLPLPGRPDTSSGQAIGGDGASQVSKSEGPLGELASTIWHELKSTITIRRHDRSIAMLLPPEQQYFLHWSLRLQLDSAALNALRGDQQAYAQDIASARHLLTTYFIAESPKTRQFLTDLKTLGAQPVSQALPDISGSLRALRAQTHAVISPMANGKEAVR